MTESLETGRSDDPERVELGETHQFRFEVSETYITNPVLLPVTVVDGENPGPTMFPHGGDPRR